MKVTGEGEALRALGSPNASGSCLGRVCPTREPRLSSGVECVPSASPSCSRDISWTLQFDLKPPFRAQFESVALYPFTPIVPSVT